MALTVGFCTQAHFSTVFKRITGDTPARWRCASRNASASSRLSGGDPASTYKAVSHVLPADFSCIMRNEKHKGFAKYFGREIGNAVRVR
nr:hypothetical protein [Bradyrhizobium sp. cf659]